MAKGTPLEGTGDDNPGVPAARQLWQDLQNQKHVPNVDAKDPLASGASSSLALQASPNGQPSANVAGHNDKSELDPDPGAQCDPLQMASERRAEQSCQANAYYDN